MFVVDVQAQKLMSFNNDNKNSSNQVHPPAGEENNN